MTPNKYVRNCWYAAGFSHEFEVGRLSGPRIAGRPIVMWRTTDGKVVAFDDRCAHKRFPLSNGRLMDDGTIECAYHGLRYDDCGQCVAIPSQPDGKIPPKAKLNAFPVTEQDGIVWIWPGDPAKSDDRKPPGTPVVADPEWESIDSGPMHIPANYLLLIENLLDITHFYPLHDGNIGDIENSYIPIEFDEGDVDGNHYVMTTRQVENYRQPPFLKDWFVYDVVDRIHTHRLVSPGLTHVEMRVAPPGELGTEKERGYTLLHTHTPIDDDSHIWRWCVNCRRDHMSGGDPRMSAAKRVASMFADVVAEDRWALEKQQEMFAFPDDGYAEVFLKSDIALNRARQMFRKMLRVEKVEAAGRQAAE